MKKIQDINQQELAQKKILVRFDLNIPMGDDGILHEEDTDRIKKSLPTLEFLKQAGAKIIIISHIGRNPSETLKPIADYMNIPLHPLFGFDEKVFETHQVVMLENLRSVPQEEANDPQFAQMLAGYADYFVNDAFAVSHRPHASVVGIPKYIPSYAGIQMMLEIENLDKALHPIHPALLIMGGAKFETKLPVIQKLLPLTDTIFIGGALVNNFFQEKGYEVGKSLLDTSAHLGELVTDRKILLSDQVIVQNDKDGGVTGPEKFAAQISPDDRIVDVIIPDELIQKINNAKTIIWNGPMGNYENGFIQGTETLTHLLAKSQAFSIIGGGDSVALIQKLNLEKSFGFLSTGGGAMLEYLVQGSLPGIEALG